MPDINTLTTHFCWLTKKKKKKNFVTCAKGNLSKGVDSNQSFLFLYYTGNCSIVQGLFSLKGTRVAFSNGYKIVNDKVIFKVIK